MAPSWRKVVPTDKRAGVRGWTEVAGCGPMCSRCRDMVGVETRPMAGLRVSLRARHQPSRTGPPSGPRSRLRPGRTRWSAFSLGVAAVIEARPGVDGTVMITCRVPSATDAERLRVVGEFNGSSTVANSMERGGDGFVARMSLPIGRVHRFRYLIGIAHRHRRSPPQRATTMGPADLAHRVPARPHASTVATADGRGDRQNSELLRGTLACSARCRNRSEPTSLGAVDSSPEVTDLRVYR